MKRTNQPVVVTAVKKRVPILLTLKASLFLLLAACLMFACSPQKDGSISKNNDSIVRSEIKPEAENQAADMTLVVATRLREGPIDSFIEVSTDVESLNSVDLYSHLSNIQITEVLADEGDFVKQGELLADLDSVEIELELDQAEVNHVEAKQRLTKYKIAVDEATEKRNSARIQSEKAKKDYDKTLKMVKDDLLAEEELDSDRLAWEKAASELEQARLQQEQAAADLELGDTELAKCAIAVSNSELKLSRTRIKAPFNGYISYKNATQGMTVLSGSHLFTLVNTDILVANLYIPQEDLLEIKTGLPVKFRCDALPGNEFSGTISVVNPVVDPTSGTVKLRCDINAGRETLLRPGMFITARIITASRKKALLIPRKAVFYDDEKPTFFLIDQENTVQRIHFEPGASTQLAREILSTQPETDRVTDGALIVIVGQDNLKNGDKVTVVEEK